MLPTDNSSTRFFLLNNCDEISCEYKAKLGSLPKLDGNIRIFVGSVLGVWGGGGVWIKRNSGMTAI